MKVYPYCVLSERVTLPPIRGLEGSAILQVEIGEFVVLLSDHDFERIVASRENVLKHDEVVRSVLGQATPLPFRFGNLTTIEQIRSYVSSRKDILSEMLARVEGCVEMSVKIIWQHDDQDADQLPDSGQTGLGQGAAFLKLKQAEILGAESRFVDAKALASWFNSELNSTVLEQKVSLRPAERLVFSGSYLVKQLKLDEYKQKVTTARDKRKDLHFLTSGPWPPYSFSNNELEFKSHLGVS